MHGAERSDDRSTDCKDIDASGSAIGGKSSEKDILLSQIETLHTTPMGVERIKRNLSFKFVRI